MCAVVCIGNCHQHVLFEHIRCHCSGPVCRYVPGCVGFISDSVKHLVIPSIISMWKFKSADDSGGNPLLESLNGNIGRQVWVHDADAGSEKDRENVERLREHFTRNRHRQKHSGDELLRYVKEAVGLFEFPVGRQPDAFPSSFGVRYAEPRCRLYRLTRLL